MHLFSRALAYLWALPTTLVGLLLGALALLTGGRAAWVAGVLEVRGGAPRRMMRALPFARGGGAMTLGHVVLGTSRSALTATRSHERVHVAQCERWGPLFLPVYVALSLWALARGAHGYHDNRFEREAFEKAAPPRPVRAMMAR